MRHEAYLPRTWRTHPLHISPADPFSWDDPSMLACLNWIFFISSLNFTFWSELEGQGGRYGVEWRDAWGSDTRVLHTGYWSLVAAVIRALEEGIQLTDPAFFASEIRCPDALIEHVLRPASQSIEVIPLLRERIAVLRKVGSILCQGFGGSFYGFIQAFRRRYSDRGTALQLVKMVADTFPPLWSTVDEPIYIWKHAQILVAETWAAFYPKEGTDGGRANEDAVSSVMIDFYLWDLAKQVGGREGASRGVETCAMLPVHRTRSI